MRSRRGSEPTWELLAGNPEAQPGRPTVCIEPRDGQADVCTAQVATNSFPCLSARWATGSGRRLFRSLVRWSVLSGSSCPPGSPSPSWETFLE